MSFLSGIENFVQPDESLAEYTYFKIGGPAQYLATPTDNQQLQTLITRCRDEDLPIRVLGAGSNILVADEGVKGVVIRLSDLAFTGVTVEKNLVTACGGAKLSHVISVAVGEGLAGLETLVGIPGTIGGALHGNAGGRGGDIGQWTRKATVITRSGEIHERQKSDMSFGYRESSLDELVILSAQFELQEDDVEALTKRLQKKWIVKKTNQPLANQSAGCIFKNPQGTSAAQLIEDAGLKNKQVGGAEVSERHANFIVAHSNTSSADVLKLIQLVQDQVEEKTGIQLVPEINVWEN